jgi:hypothetical protein
VSSETTSTTTTPASARPAALNAAASCAAVAGADEHTRRQERQSAISDGEQHRVDRALVKGDGDEGRHGDDRAGHVADRRQPRHKHGDDKAQPAREPRDAPTGGFRSATPPADHPQPRCPQHDDAACDEPARQPRRFAAARERRPGSRAASDNARTAVFSSTQPE